AAAEVRDDNFLSGNLRKDVVQNAGDVFIRESMKAVAPHALFFNFVRQGNEVNDRRVRTVETRGETGDLGNIGQTIENCFDRGEVVRLMQRRQRNQFVQLSQDFLSDDNWPSELRAAVHHAMAHAYDLRASV